MKRKQRICKYPRCYAVYTASAEAQAASWGGGADNSPTGTTLGKTALELL